MAAVDEYSQLKRLILGQEQQSLERLQDRVEKTATRAQDVAEVLVESFELNQDKPDSLAAAMRAPVQRCISDAVREDPDEFANALFPVIGPAIRKAVRESISALSEKINQTLERSFSAQGLKWRIESLRTGVPVSEIVLRDSFVYRVDQAFVIQRNSGLLIAHVAREGTADQDSDAVSAMLTAIQDFVSDSFTAGDGSDLDTIRVGGEVVWIFHGPDAITAAIIHGQPPREVRDVFEEVTESVHRLYGEEIENFAGGQALEQQVVTGVCALLQPLIDSERLRATSVKSEHENTRSLKLIALVGLIIVLGWILHAYLEGRKRDALVAALNETPGIEVISVEQNNPYVIKAFRDPLAPNLAQLQDEHALKMDEATIKFIPFQSLAPEIVARRLRDLFDAPADVNIEVLGSRLVLSGQAPSGFRARLAAFPLSIFGINEVDTRELNTASAEILAAVRNELQAPDTASLRFNDGVVYISGQLPLAWMISAKARKLETAGVSALDFAAARPANEKILAYLRSESAAPDLVGMKLDGETLQLSGSHSETWRQSVAQLALATPFITTIDDHQFVPSEQEEMAVLVTYVGEQVFFFSRNDEFAGATVNLMRRLGEDIRRLAEIDALLSKRQVRYKIRAFADNTGTAEQNATVRRKRVAAVVAYLLEKGVAESQIESDFSQTEVANDDSPRWRRAEIDLSLE